MSARQVVEQLVSAESGPVGVVAGIANAERRETAAAGLANAAGESLTLDAVFDIASVTKVAATTSALLRLVTLGLIAFDDAVSRFIPMTVLPPQATLRHLLQHRTGLWEWQPLYLDDRDPWVQIEALPLRYPFGEARHYSDLGFMLLGRVIASATGMHLDAAIRELVTAPLGLTRTGYRPGTDTGLIVASGHGDATERRMVESGEPYPILTDRRSFSWREAEIVGQVNDGNAFHSLGGVSGHAGLFSTVDDLLTLGSALASADRHTDLWNPDAVSDLFQDGPDAGQALGWRSERVRIDGREQRMLWHPGFTGCALGVVPDADAAVVMLSNRLLATTAPTTTAALWRRALPLLLDEAHPGITEGTRRP